MALLRDSAWSRVMSKSSTIFPISATLSSESQPNSPFLTTLPARIDSVLGETGLFSHSKLKFPGVGVSSGIPIGNGDWSNRLFAASFADLSIQNALQSTHFLADRHAL